MSTIWTGTGLEIATDTVTNATNISALATRNPGLVAIMARLHFSVLTINNGYFLYHYVFAENHIERSSFLITDSLHWCNQTKNKDHNLHCKS